MNYRRCAAITLENVQCKKETTGEYCYMHKSPMSDTLKQMYIEARKRSERYLKYAMREYRKYRIRHQKYMESNICKAVTKKGYRCGVVTKFTYCNIHKHLDTTREKEILDVKRKDVTAIVNDLMSKYHSVEDREYQGYETNPIKINKIKDAYKEERYEIERLYRQYFTRATESMNDDDLDNIYEQIDESIKEINNETDEAILVIETEEDTSEIGMIIAQFEKEKNLIKRREYKGPILYPHIMKQIEAICDNEMKEKILTYDNIARQISYRDPIEDYVDIQELKAIPKKHIKELEKRTEGKIKAFMPRKKNPSKYY